MFSNKKWSLAFAVVIIAAVVLSACGPADGDGDETGEFTDYKVGMFEDPVSLNYWNYLGPGSSVWTQYVVSGYAASLYTLADKTFQFVPSLANDIYEPVQEGDVWTVTVEMVEDAEWSDGESIDANDVVFTHNTCKDLQLTQNWPNSCAPLGMDVQAEIVDDYTVKYTFPENPGLGAWQAGVALAPILPEHFWAETVQTARNFVEGVEAPDVDCGAEDLSEEDAQACEEYSLAFENARKTLYEASAEGSPTAGGFTTDQFEPGGFVQRTQNDNYYFEGAQITEYDDDTWVLTMPDGREVQLYGDAEGEQTLQYTSGPYAPNVVMSIYGSQDAAFLALENGEIDFVFSPTGIPRGLRDRATSAPGINTYVNADYGMYYIAFNMRKEPMSMFEFRQALDILIDKDFVVNSILQGTVFPMYSTMPPGNEFFYNDDIEFPYKDMTREERVNEVVRVLTEAGWSWESEPEWDPDAEDVIPGTGLTMPNGDPMPELTVLGPGPAYDPIRATFNQWIVTWANDVGMPLESELTGFNNILGPVFTDATFDMYILGWSLGNPAFPDYYYSFFHSSQDTATTGNFNTPGFNNEEFDATVEEFMSTTSIETAQELVFDLQEIMAEQRPYIPLYYKQVYDVARENLEFPYTEVLSGITEAAGFQTDVKPLAQ